MKSARFASLVEAAGNPSPYLLWVPPEKDRTLQQAVKNHRVLTVHQNVRGSKKDFGTVGFVQEPEAQYLVFPRSLRKFQDQRVVGINYELLDPAARGPQLSAAELAAIAPKKKTPKPKPAAELRPVAPPHPIRRLDRSEVSESENTAEPSALPEDIAASPAEPPPPGPAKSARSERTASRAASASTPAARATPILPELRRAVNELKAGKTVPAYERLQRLLEQLEQA